jgi:hypothetical protein
VSEAEELARAIVLGVLLAATPGLVVEFAVRVWRAAAR